MPIEVKVKEQHLGSFVKLTCVVSLFGENTEMEKVTVKYNVNNLANVILKFECKNEDFPLKCSILAQNHEKAKNLRVQIKVSCGETDVPFYSKWICNGQYKFIGVKAYSDMVVKDVYTSLWNINITAIKIEENYLMKFYNDVTFTDFNLCAVDGSVPVHRAYLASHSDVFQAMLNHEWKETSEGCVQMEGVTRQTLQHLKEYMYLRTLPNDGLESLLLLASYYMIDDLKEECVSKLALNHTRTSEDWSRLLEFAAVNKLSDLISGIMLNTSFAVKK